MTASVSRAQIRVTPLIDDAPCLWEAQPDEPTMAHKIEDLTLINFDK